MPIKRRFLAGSLCGVTTTCLLMSVIPGITGGRLGIIAVRGDSMTAIPHASRVVVLPLRARPGDYVTAWGSLDRPESSDDSRPCLLVKLYDGQRLVSTATRQTCSRFDLRGRVVAMLPVQKLCPRLARDSSLLPAPLYKPRTVEEQRQVVLLRQVQRRHARRFLASGDARWRALDNTTLTGQTKRVCVLKLPEPCTRIGLCATTGPEAEIRVCAGEQTVARYVGMSSDIASISAPPGQRIDRLVLALGPREGLVQHVTLRAVRKLVPAEGQVCARAETGGRTGAP